MSHKFAKTLAAFLGMNPSRVRIDKGGSEHATYTRIRVANSDRYCVFAHTNSRAFSCVVAVGEIAPQLFNALANEIEDGSLKHRISVCEKGFVHLLFDFIPIFNDFSMDLKTLTRLLEIIDEEVTLVDGAIEISEKLLASPVPRLVHSVP